MNRNVIIMIIFIGSLYFLLGHVMESKRQHITKPYCEHLNKLLVERNLDCVKKYNDSMSVGSGQVLKMYCGRGVSVFIDIFVGKIDKITVCKGSDLIIDN